MAITKGQIVKYAVLPGFWPRIRDLVGSGFSHVALYIAIIYRNVRLLPAGHPYLNPDNFGRFGIRHVIAEAANNLVFTKKNIDQIFVFFMILAGVVILLTQVVLFVFSLIATQPAMALGLVPFLDWFQNPNPAGYSVGPEQDLVFSILDHVFGLNQRFFGSCVSSTAAVCVDMHGNPIPKPAVYPTPMHTALHDLFRFYSHGIVLVAVLVLLYYVVTIVGETVAEGTPFGHRFNKAWAPVRIVMFFAMIIPLNIGTASGGLNGAQVVTFWVAKWGSNMATNTWGRFNDTLLLSYLGDTNNLIALPTPPEIGSLGQFLFVAKTCQLAERVANNRNIQGYIVRERVTGTDQLLIDTTNFATALNFARNGTIIIRFGELDPGYAAGGDPTKYAGQKGYVFPWCGEIHVQPNDVFEEGSRRIQELYYNMVDGMWQGSDARNDAVTCIVRRVFPIDANAACPDWPDRTLFTNEIASYDIFATGAVANAVNQQAANGDFTVSPQLQQMGWGGAAIWYNRIAQMNGAVTASILNIPKPSKFPYLMEEVLDQHRRDSQTISSPEMFDPLMPTGKLADLGDHPYAQEIAAVLYRAYVVWENDGGGSTGQTQKTESIVINAINLIFGTSGIFDMRRNPTTHPLAQLSALGRGLVEAAVRNAIPAMGGAVGASLSSLLADFIGDISRISASMFGTFVQITIVMGVILYYVLPFMPFIYFLFAVGGWVKSIFEAVVAMPLWALAHIHIDGEGLPGRNAANGYYLLLEILLRPTLIVFGLLGSIIVFSSLVTALNQIFDMVISNVGGFDIKQEILTPGKMAFYRSPIDEFFLTVMYVVIVYIIGLSTFKMIDQVPNNILRWIGMSVSTFKETAGDPAGELSGDINKGGTMIVGQIFDPERSMLSQLVKD